MFKTIDLFAGAGGLSYGFIQTGQFQIVAAAEINKNAQATYKKNISENISQFEFIDDVVGYDFNKLNEKFNGIDVVIGGPPCQGFSNANRQKNHLICMNNSLVKEYFRAIRQIKPKAFIMENVSMLRSETHRFYESLKDNDEIDALMAKGVNLPKRRDTLVISKEAFTDIDMENIVNEDLNRLTIPADLKLLLSVLDKNLNNPRKLPKYLLNHSREIINKLKIFIETMENSKSPIVLQKLLEIKDAVEKSFPNEASDALSYIVGLQKVLETIHEIKENQLIGKFKYTSDNQLVYEVNSYSVIDYIKAILGGEYCQKGETINAENFGVPQERKRYIVIGIRKDVIGERQIEFPSFRQLQTVTIGDAILDLQSYEAAYKADAALQPYHINPDISQLLL